MRRRLADGLELNANYLISKLYGNFSGLASSDENGRSSPNVNRFFDGIYMSFDEKGNPTNGRLGTDRPHQFKTQVIYTFRFGTTLGFNQYVASGTPISRQVSNFGLPFFYLGRGSEGRTPVLSQSDLALTHEFRFGSQRLQLLANIQNLFDQDTTTDIFNTELQTGQNLSIRRPGLLQTGWLQYTGADRVAESPPRSALPAGLGVPGASRDPSGCEVPVLSSEVPSRRRGTPDC